MSVRAVRVLLAVVAAAAVAAGLGGWAYHARGDSSSAFDAAASDMTPQQARTFADYRLYWAGMHFEGLPLRAITRRADAPHPLEPIAADYVAFLYGDCDAGDSDRGCALPLEIQVWPASARHAGSYALTPAGDASSTPRPLRRERLLVRGVPAAYFHDGARLELYTRSETIVMFGRTRAQLLRAAGALRGANHATGPAEPLTPRA